MNITNILSRFFLLLIISPLCLSAQNDSGKIFNSFDNTKIYYEIKGEGIPIVLIHGFSNTGDSWKSTSLYNNLLKAGYQVITLDLRGNGRSDKPHTPEAYEKDAEARDIIALTNMLKLKSYCAIGYSRGAIIVSRLLVLDNTISKAILGGMGADFTNPLWPRRIMFYNALMGEPVPELESFLQYIKNKGLDQLALAYQQKAQPSSSIEELGAIKKPVMVICGDADQDNGSAKKLSELIPKSIFITVPGDHNSTTRSNEFSTAVIAFLKKI